MLQVTDYLNPEATKAHAKQDLRSKSIEWVHTEDDIIAAFKMLKIVEQYEQSNGWVLLIAPNNVPSKHLLETTSVNTDKLLVLREKHISDLAHVLHCALYNGKFSAVITWNNIVSPSQLAQLNTEKAAAKYYCFTERLEQSTSMSKMPSLSGLALC